MLDNLFFNIDYKPFINLVLRSLSMACKFFLIIFMAKIFSPDEVGLFGLFLVTLVYAQLIIGGEFYTYSQRELILQGSKKYSFVLQHQALALLFLYIFIIPLLTIIFAFDTLPQHWAKWFFLLLFFEAIAQELNRILIALEHQISASIILFFRQGLWVILIFFYMYLNPNNQSVELVFKAWLYGSIFSVILGMLFIRRVILITRLKKIDFHWIKKGFKVSFLFFIGALCFKGLFTFDRYVVEAIVGTSFLGIYVVYIGIAMSLFSILDPLVFSFSYPKIINSIAKKNISNFNMLMKILAKKTIFFSTIFIFFVFFISPYLFMWLGNPIYSDNLNILMVLLAASYFYALSMIPHYGLYALKKDKLLMTIHLMCFLVFVFFLYILQFYFINVQVAGVSLLLTFLLMGAAKLLFLLKYRNLEL